VDGSSKSERKQTFEVEIRVNTAAKPKQIDTKNLDGPEKGSISVGIYELRICHTWKGQTKRPEKFAIAEGSGLVLAVWKREKK
jgi:uncharacterized protein (TIGR03067 family)